MTSSVDMDLLRRLEFDVPDRARKALNVSGTSVGDMAEYLGITRETASRYINGRSDMPLQTMRLWAMRTGVPFAWLQTGKVPSPTGDGTSAEECAIRDSNPEPAGKCTLTALPQLTLLDSYRYAGDVARVERAA